jgi:MinD-like ATPase involved in chromosome partitioning or flagellar assembly
VGDDERGPALRPVVTVFGVTGGVGTTTAAALLAEAMASRGSPVTAVDLNAHAPHLAEALGVTTPPDGLEAYLRDPARPVLPVDNASLYVVPGLSNLDDLDDLSVGSALTLLDRLRPAALVIDVAPVVVDPAVYASLRFATDLVLVAEPRPACLKAARRLRALFERLGLPWGEATLLVTNTRPGPGTDGPLPRIDWYGEIGLSPACELPYGDLCDRATRYSALARLWPLASRFLREAPGRVAGQEPRS